MMARSDSRLRLMLSSVSLGIRSRRVTFPALLRGRGFWARAVLIRVNAQAGFVVTVGRTPNRRLEDAVGQS